MLHRITNIPITPKKQKKAFEEGNHHFYSLLEKMSRSHQSNSNTWEKQSCKGMIYSSCKLVFEKLDIQLKNQFNTQRLVSFLNNN